MEPLLCGTLSPQMHEPSRQRIAVQCHMEWLSREKLDAYLAHQFKTAGVTQPLLEETGLHALYHESFTHHDQLAANSLAGLDERLHQTDVKYFTGVYRKMPTIGTTFATKLRQKNPKSFKLQTGESAS